MPSPKVEPFTPAHFHIHVPTFWLVPYFHQYSPMRRHGCQGEYGHITQDRYGLPCGRWESRVLLSRGLNTSRARQAVTASPPLCHSCAANVCKDAGPWPVQPWLPHGRTEIVHVPSHSQQGMGNAKQCLCGSLVLGRAQSQRVQVPNIQGLWSQTLNGVWDQSPSILGTWTLWGRYRILQDSQERGKLLFSDYRMYTLTSGLWALTPQNKASPPTTRTFVHRTQSLSITMIFVRS